MYLVDTDERTEGEGADGRVAPLSKWQRRGVSEAFGRRGRLAAHPFGVEASRFIECAKQILVLSRAEEAQVSDLPMKPQVSP